MQYFGERLKAARKIKGWSLQDLANKTSNSITKQALSKYEADVMHPSRKILLLLSDALGVKPSYFDRQPIIKLPDFDFPRRGAVPAKQTESIKEQAKVALERYLQAEALLDISIKFHNPVRGIPVSNEQEAAMAAGKLQHKWDLGCGPLLNVMSMLEGQGIRVLEVATPVAFDALSTYVGKVPLIVVHRDKPADCKRYAALYELGHLLLSFSPSADREKLCQTFAAALLLPDDTLARQLGTKRTNIAPGELLCLKEQYGIPMQAIMRHAIFLDIIDRKETVPFFKTIAEYKDETGLGHYAGTEKTCRFERLLLRLVAEDIIPIHKAASLAEEPEEVLRKRLSVFETVQPVNE
jgi:Zn-dependent peptidase ImmA (M78 family)